jgi:hypothetical protein
MHGRACAVEARGTSARQRRSYQSGGAVLRTGPTGDAGRDFAPTGRAARQIAYKHSPEFFVLDNDQAWISYIQPRCHPW